MKMRIFLLFLALSLVFVNCKKSEPLPAGTLQVNGALHYDKGLGSSLGLYFLTDSNKTMIFTNNFASDSLEYIHYIYYVNVNTTLFYFDKGEGCYSAVPSLCGIPLAEIVKFQIR